jgi:hypothetical protein
VRRTLFRSLSIVIVAGMISFFIKLSITPRIEDSDMKAANSDIYALRGGQPYGARGISIEQLMTLP